MTISDTSYENGSGRENSGAPFAEQAKQVANDLKDAASAVVDGVSDAAKQEAEEIGVAAKEILDHAADRVKSSVKEQKEAGAEYLERVASAIDRAAGEFEADVPQAARYIRQAGSELNNVATAVRQRDLRELVSEVENVARRQPALFFGGAVVLGFAALRFLKSAPPKALEDKTDHAKPEPAQP
jgi:gas vesicle protein